jgi:tRNA-Thr(GGU) m(6)t(6)A37 methyltransferase TsaA
MARFFQIGGQWIGWPLCSTHLLEYRQAQPPPPALINDLNPSSIFEEKMKMEMENAPVTTTGTDAEAQPTRRKRRRKAAAERQQMLEEEGSSASGSSSSSSSSSSAKMPLAHVPLQPIGLFESCFLERHGTPRQGLLVPSSRGRLTLRRTEALTNPRDALVGLDGFSHVWLVFLFHNNAGHPQNKIHPPRLGGRKLGMLATRTPHRPCPVGLSVARIERIDGDTLHLAGVDLVHNTPVLDVKPYIARYDALADAVTADWLVETDSREAGAEGRLRVEMSDEAVASLQRYADDLRFFRGDWERARRCIEEVLALDIRTLHMKRRHREGTYGVSIDVMNVSFAVNAESGLCTVLRIDLWPESYDHLDFGEVKRKRVAATATSATTATTAGAADTGERPDAGAAEAEPTDS